MKAKFFFSFLCTIFMILLWPEQSVAQNNDAGCWLGINFEKKITPSLSVAFTEELRMQENITQAGTIFSDIGLQYKINRYFTTGIFYRFIEKRNMDASYSSRHRFYVDLGGKIKIKKFAFLLRERIQSQVQDCYSSDNGRFPEWYLRSKLTVKYSLTRRIVPLAGIELFYQLSNLKGNEPDQIRYFAGLNYAFNKRHSIEPFYLIRQELNANNPGKDFIFGLSYNLTL